MADRDLTETTTQREYLVVLAESYARSAKFGGNRAILSHLVKVADMEGRPELWAAHRDQLLGVQRDPVRQEVIRELADELMLLRED